MSEYKRKVSTIGLAKQDWLKHRKDGIGCSDVSTIMGLNPYQSSIELFYYKLGEIADQETNIAMFMGGYMEDCVADLFQYYGEDQEEMIRNYESGNKVYKIQKVNAILTNDKYTWLLGNLDRLITSPKKMVLEIKTIAGYAADKWEDGIPPYFLAQTQAYMLLTGLNESRIAILKDGRYLEVYSLTANEEFQQEIIIQCSAFWQRVISAKILKEEGKPYESLEPEPDNTEVYGQFLKERYREVPTELVGDAATLKIARDYLAKNEEIKIVKAEKEGLANLLKYSMKENQKIDFGKAGYVSWKSNKNGSRTLSVKVKPEIKTSENEQAA